MKIGGVILAGGRATRMGGGDKGALSLCGRSLFDRVIDRLGPQVDRLAINANGNPLRLLAYDLPVLPDSLPDHPGPLAGVLAGMDWGAEQGLTHVVTAAADTPFFPTDLVQRLTRAAAAASAPIALAGSVSDGRLFRHPTFGFWPVDLRDNLRSALEGGLRKVVIWTDTHGAATAHFAEEDFFNINTPEDLKAAETMHGQLLE